MTMIALLERAGCAATAAPDVEAALRALLTPLHQTLGDRSGGAELPERTEQFFIAGAFMVSPDAEWHILTSNLGFPPEQTRLMIPITGGHPGRVYQSRKALHLADTEADGKFRQYLKTARMASAIYVPLLWEGRFLGQIVMAARARNSLSTQDFNVMRAAAPLAAALWIAKGGDDWLAATYPPPDGFRVSIDGI
jgi:hypothetical protein